MPTPTNPTAKQMLFTDVPIVAGIVGIVFWAASSVGTTSPKDPCASDTPNAQTATQVQTAANRQTKGNQAPECPAALTVK